MVLTFFQYHIHYLLYLTIAYMLGVYCYSVSLSFLLYGLVTIFFFSLTAWYVHITRFSLPWTLLLFLSAYSAGVGRLYLCYKNQAAFDRFIQAQPCDIIGQISNIHPVDHPRFRHCITIKLQTIRHSTSDWKTSSEVLQLYIPRDVGLMVSDIIAVNNLVFKKNNGSTGFTQYRMKEGISASLFLDEFRFSIIERPQWSCARWLHTKRHNVWAQLQKKLSRPTAHLFSSIFLGNKYARKKDIEPLKEHFTTWGVTHYLARSGLHMVIFTITWHTLLTFIPLAFALKEALLIALVIIYALLSWTTISFTRALLLFLIHRLCSLLRLQTDLLYLLTLVALAILFDNPLQLFFLDFQLSFGLTFALAYFGQLQTYYRHSRHKTIASA